MLLQPSPLPYSPDALEPHISERTVNLHYDKHHKGDLDKLNHALSDHPPMEIRQLMNVSDSNVTNLAAQEWNHAFYWNISVRMAVERREARLRGVSIGTSAL